MCLILFLDFSSKEWIKHQLKWLWNERQMDGDAYTLPPSFLVVNSIVRHTNIFKKNRERDRRRKKKQFEHKTINKRRTRRRKRALRDRQQQKRKNYSFLLRSPFFPRFVYCGFLFNFFFFICFIIKRRSIKIFKRTNDRMRHASNEQMNVK